MTPVSVMTFVFKYAVIAKERCRDCDDKVLRDPQVRIVSELLSAPPVD